MKALCCIIVTELLTGMASVMRLVTGWKKFSIAEKIARYEQAMALLRCDDEQHADVSVQKRYAHRAGIHYIRSLSMFQSNTALNT